MDYKELAKIADNKLVKDMAIIFGADYRDMIDRLEMIDVDGLREEIGE